MHDKAAARKKHAFTAIVSALAFTVSPLASVLAARPTPKKRVLLVPAQKDHDVPAIVVTKTQGYAETLLAMDGKLVVISPGSLVASDAGADKDEAEEGPEGMRALAAAKQAVTKATKLSKRRRWAKAREAWNEALAHYKTGLGYLEDNGELVAVYLGLAYAFFGEGYADNGEEELAKALAMDPTLELDAKAPRGAKDVIERVRTRVSSATGLQLQVKANARRATVFVNGKNRGQAPLTLGDLGRGSHAVRVVAEGYQPYGEVVSLVINSAVVDAQLVAKPNSGVAAPMPVQPKTGLEGFARKGDFGADFQKAAKAIAKANDLDAIAMTYVRRNEEKFEIGMVVWEARRGRIGETESAMVAADLAGLQVAVLDLVERGGEMVVKMPREQVVTGTPAIYRPRSAAVAVAEPPPDTTPDEPLEVSIDERPTDEPVAASEAPEDPNDEPIGSTTDPTVTAVDEPLVLEPLVLDPVDERVTSEQNLSDPDTGKSESAFYETWWFWTIVGGVAAGSAAAIALSSSGGGSSSPGGFSTTVSW